MVGSWQLSHTSSLVYLTHLRSVEKGSERNRGINELWSADALSTTSPGSLRRRHHKPSALREAVISYRTGIV